MPCIGITGGIATGKSAVAALFEKFGAIVFSADDAARATMAAGSPTLQRIRETFGEEYLRSDGTLDRAKMGACIFANPEARQKLETITHPPILRLLNAQIAAVREDFPSRTVIAVEVPLLFETHLQGWFDKVVVVAASEATQIRRLQARNNLTPEEAQRRIRAQMPLQEKIERADFVVYNDADAASLERQVRDLFEALKQLSD
jgi:dephospho-CoA kinase